MKIQFIIVGWHFDAFPEFIDGLIQLKKLNPNVNIFWTCHREPSQIIKDNFDFKVFPNLGLEDGAYQQALDFLHLHDDTVLFLMHDDLIVKDWGFIPVCLNLLKERYAFIGNGINYGTSLNPVDIPNGRDKRFIDYVKPEAKHLFGKAENIHTVRESFICTIYGYLKSIFEFEVIWEEPVADKDGKFHIGGIGNLQQTLLGYKMSKVYPGRITYLSSTYQDSEYLYECARGKTE